MGVWERIKQARAESKERNIQRKVAVERAKANMSKQYTKTYEKAIEKEYEKKIKVEAEQYAKAKTTPFTEKFAKFAAVRNKKQPRQVGVRKQRSRQKKYYAPAPQPTYYPPRPQSLFGDMFQPQPMFAPAQMPIAVRKKKRRQQQSTSVIGGASVLN